MKICSKCGKEIYYFEWYSEDTKYYHPKCYWSKEEKTIKKENKESREEILKQLINDIMWMAVRYAHGRKTYASTIVRDVFNEMKRLYPDWDFGEDKTLKMPAKDVYNKDFYLNDLYE